MAILNSAPMNMMAGCMLLAILNSIRTSFSDSPCHLEVSDDAEMLKKVARASAASACGGSAQVTTCHGWSACGASLTLDCGFRRLLRTRPAKPLTHTVSGRRRCYAFMATSKSGPERQFLLRFG